MGRTECRCEAAALLSAGLAGHQMQNPGVPGCLRSRHSIPSSSSDCPWPGACDLAVDPQRRQLLREVPLLVATGHACHPVTERWALQRSLSPGTFPPAPLSLCTCYPYTLSHNTQWLPPGRTSKPQINLHIIELTLQKCTIWWHLMPFVSSLSRWQRILKVRNGCRVGVKSGCGWGTLEPLLRWEFSNRKIP